MSEAADIIASLRAQGMTKQAIADELGRSPRMLTKVERGETPGDHYTGALRQLQRGQTVERPERMAPVSRQRTPAGIVTRVSRRGMVGLLRALDGNRRRVSLRVAWRLPDGTEGDGWLYRRGGRVADAISDDLYALGAERDDPDAIGDALDALIDYEVADDGGGTSGIPGGATATGVTVSPA